jgi:general secretion pathway protein K
MLEALPGLDQGMVSSIIDWRDSGSDPEPNGAEEFYYQSLDHPYECKNAHIESVEELLLIKGMTPIVLAEIQNLITVYGDGRVNINTARAEVLNILGLNERLVEKIIQFREGNDGIKGTEDDNAFRDISDIKKSLIDFGELTVSEADQLDSVTDQLTVRSDYFRINSVGTLKDDKVVKKITTVVKRTPHGPPQILYWYEGSE